jgi:ClpX C4-type zinc finger
MVIDRARDAGAAVICLEVNVNGQRRVVAGIAAAEVINATVSLYPGLNEGWLEVAGSVVPDNQPLADASWLAAALSAGDVVEVRLVESEQPAAPNVSRTDPTARASDSIPLVCAFCEKTHEEVAGMVASRKAAICPECIGYLHDIISADS